MQAHVNTLISYIESLMCVQCVACSQPKLSNSQKKSIKDEYCLSDEKTEPEQVQVIFSESN